VYTKASTIQETNFIVPSLPKEALIKLPEYFRPTKNNLATQYYYWNRDLIKQNRELLKKNKELREEKQKLEQEQAELKKKKEELEIERNKFLRMIFKPNKEKQISSKKSELQIRSKQSYTRPTPKQIDETREAILKQCPHCENRLSKRVGFYQRIIEDIPSPKENKAKVIQYTINRYYCKHCKNIVSAKPKQVLPKSRIGTNTLIYVLYSKYRLRLSQNLIQENLETYFNLKISQGELNNLLNKGQQVFKQKYKKIIEKIKHSKEINADETGWRINGENSWLWAFVTKEETRYTISESRGKGVPKHVLGENYDGVVGCDFYTAYNQFKHKQRCWVHLLRKTRELVQQDPTQQRKQIKIKLGRIHQQILSFRLKAESTEYQRTAKAVQIKRKLLVLSQQKTGDHNLRKVLNRCGKYAGELVVCVQNFNVSPDNNPAERAIRPAVVMRKISGGSRSKEGAQSQAVNLSVIETLRKQKHNLFEAMEELVLGYIASSG